MIYQRHCFSARPRAAGKRTCTPTQAFRRCPRISRSSRAERGCSNMRAMGGGPRREEAMICIREWGLFWFDFSQMASARRGGAVEEESLLSVVRYRERRSRKDAACIAIHSCHWAASVFSKQRNNSTTLRIIGEYAFFTRATRAPTECARDCSSARSASWRREQCLAGAAEEGTYGPKLG